VKANIDEAYTEWNVPHTTPQTVDKHKEEQPMTFLDTDDAEAVKLMPRDLQAWMDGTRHGAPLACFRQHDGRMSCGSAGLSMALYGELATRSASARTTQRSCRSSKVQASR
jgi:hypothetical protein